MSKEFWSGYSDIYKGEFAWLLPVTFATCAVAAGLTQWVFQLQVLSLAVGASMFAFYQLVGCGSFVIARIARNRQDAANAC